MLELIVDLPDDVLGVEASGQVTAQDYLTVLLPALENKFGKSGRIRLLYVLGDNFDSYTGAAAWEDARVGFKHLTQFERVAVVTNVDWISHVIKAFRFVMPGEVRVFDNYDLKHARAWISEPLPQGDLGYEFLAEQAILVLHPKGELKESDFEQLADEIDPYIAEKGKLKGVMIVAEHFPGWDDLGAMAAHFRFVREHHRNVKKLAIVSDDILLSAIPRLAKHFVVAEVQHFTMNKQEDALAWLNAG